MKVLVACEESQRVCVAFRERGHEAYSCDVQMCSGGHPEWHIKHEERMSLADMTKTIRQETGMSQKQLAEKIGTNQTEVSFIERGFIPLNPEKQTAILNIFNEVIKGEKEKCVNSNLQ